MPLHVQLHKNQDENTCTSETHKIISASQVAQNLLSFYLFILCIYFVTTVTIAKWFLFWAFKLFLFHLFKRKEMSKKRRARQKCKVS